MDSMELNFFFLAHFLLNATHRAGQQSPSFEVDNNLKKVRQCLTIRIARLNQVNSS